MLCLKVDIGITVGHRWSSRGLKGLSTAPRGGAAMVDELCSIEDIKGTLVTPCISSFSLNYQVTLRLNFD